MPNPCNWPDFPVLMAVDLLTEIETRAHAAIDGVEIDPPVKQRIVDRVAKCIDPMLVSPKTGKHVCDLNADGVRSELVTIWRKSSPEGMPKDPKGIPKHWLTIATDLESFPTGV